MRVFVWLALCVAAVAAAPRDDRIIGGSVVGINTYPDMASLAFCGNFVNFRHNCGGIILNQRSVLTAAHCFNDARNHIGRWRVRVGSTYMNRYGTVHTLNRILVHPQFDRLINDNDVALVRVANNFRFTNVVQAGRIAGANSNIGDGWVVWAAGWGATREGGPNSEQLRHVQVWTINQNVCRQRYGWRLTNNMLCSGWLDVGGRDQCQGDSGGPLYHNRIVIGVTSWGNGCGRPRYPGVNARVPRFTAWINRNA